MRRENPITISSIILATPSFRKPSSQIRTISANYCYALFHSRIFHYLQKTIIISPFFSFLCEAASIVKTIEKKRRLVANDIAVSYLRFLLLFFYAEYTRREKKIPTTLSALTINIVTLSFFLIIIILIITIIIWSIQIAIIYMYNARAASVLCGLHCDDGDYSSSGDRYLFIGACVPREIYVVVVVVVVARISVSIERTELPLFLSLSLSLSFFCKRELEYSARGMVATVSVAFRAETIYQFCGTTNPEASSVTSPIQSIPVRWNQGGDNK